ncbi:4139_t:CDS:2, partial [Cetraspora pellucida]
SESMSDDKSDDQETDNECIPMFDNHDIANKSISILNKDNTDEFDQIFEEGILKNYEETDNEFWSNDSEYNNSGDAILKFVKKYSQISKKIFPRSTKEGLHFLDSLEKNYTKFFSTPVMQVRGQTYSFKYRPIISAVREILQDQEITMNCVFDYQEIYVSNEASTVPKRMHHLDLGLCLYMIKFTRDLLKFYGGITLVNKMDLRLGLVPCHPGLKVFNSGLADLALFIASKYKHMMKVMPFVLEGLIEAKKNKSLIRMFISWNKMYHQSKQHKFTHSDLLQFEFLKFHHWIYHTVETIKEYGNLNGLSAETYEALHKQYIKTPYRMSNKCNINIQILQKVIRTLTLKGIYEHILSQNGKSKSKENTRKFGKKYCTILRQFLKSLIEIYMHNEEHTSEILEGLCHLIPAMNNYFDLMSVSGEDINESELVFILYESFALSNKEQVRAMGHYYNMLVFSNISVYMGSRPKEFETFNGYCFAK